MLVNDADLLETIALDPQEGIRQVLDRYGPRLLGRLRFHARARGYGDANVEDVLQEALLSLLDPDKRAALLARGGDILPWLSRLGFWRLDDQDETRRTALRRHTSAEAMGESSESSSAPAQAVRTVIHLLSPRDRDILRWRYEERLGNAEVSARLGIGEGAAKKATHDARRRLKNLLLEAGLYDADEER